MSNYSVEAKSLTKLFGRRLIFKDINFTYNKPGVYGISGPNGSGKSTLVKIIAGLIAKSSGSLQHFSNENRIIDEKLHNYIGFVSPYLVLYEEFTAIENLEKFAKIRGIKLDEEKVHSLLKVFLLYERRNDLLKTYSSGMKQRMKFIFALIHSPSLLILDEPTSNLDDEGKESVYKIVGEERVNRIVIIASNEKTDLQLCDEVLYLQDYKNIEMSN